jgi:hypothetical protein
MAKQYKYLSEGQYMIIPAETVGGIRTRFGQRSGQFVNDAELSVGGFSLAENVGWENLQTYEDTIITGGRTRIGILSEYSEQHIVIDGEKTTIGIFERIQTYE